MTLAAVLHLGHYVLHALVTDLHVGQHKQEQVQLGAEVGVSLCSSPFAPLDPLSTHVHPILCPRRLTFVDCIIWAPLFCQQQALAHDGRVHCEFGLCIPMLPYLLGCALDVSRFPSSLPQGHKSGHFLTTLLLLSSPLLHPSILGVEMTFC